MKIVVAAIVAVVGAFVAAAMFGLIEVPGISPAKKKALAQRQYDVDGGDEAQGGQGARDQNALAPERGLSKPVIAATDKGNASVVPKARPAAPEVEFDPYAGQKKLAKVWADLDAASISRIVADWKDDELAKQLFVMPPSQSGEVLAALKPERASKVSKLLQKLGEQKAKNEASAAPG